jgi:hypothetical protein
MGIILSPRSGPHQVSERLKDQGQGNEREAAKSQESLIHHQKTLPLKKKMFPVPSYQFPFFMQPAPVFPFVLPRSMLLAGRHPAPGNWQRFLLSFPL